MAILTLHQDRQTFCSIRAHTCRYRHIKTFFSLLHMHIHKHLFLTQCSILRGCISIKLIAPCMTDDSEINLLFPSPLRFTVHRNMILSHEYQHESFCPLTEPAPFIHRLLSFFFSFLTAPYSGNSRITNTQLTNTYEFIVDLQLHRESN